MRVALRFGYGNMGLPTSFQALRSTSSREIGRNLPLYTMKEECRKLVNSGLHPDTCKARSSSSAPGTSVVSNELVEDKRPPQGLTAATPLASICAPPYPDKTRRYDLREQTPRAARVVLTTPFDVDPRSMLPACTVDVSLSGSRWTSREHPASSRIVS